MRTSLKLMLVLALGAMALAGCSDDDETAPVVDPPELAFVGSDICLECHPDEHAKWQDSGHPYKLTKIDGVSPDGEFPTFSEFPRDPVIPPVGYDWTTVTYTIGGYGWKMRWIDSNGYIITQLPDTQYNFENDTRVVYHPDDAPGTKPYDCGVCHTTGWVDSDDGIAENNQDGLAGMVGTFFAGGVHCEECHGMGSQHAFSRSFDMTLDHSSELCGRCHTRDAENHIAGSGFFIKHHEQYDEWLHSPHSADGAPGCNTCHDPHSTVKFNGEAGVIGDDLLMTCTDCHSVAGGSDQNYDGENLKHPVPYSCKMCHMPKASKSAIAADTYVGDIRTHIFSINPAAEGRETGMFNAEGTQVLEDINGQSVVTLDYACYSCHDSEPGGLAKAPYLSLQDLSDFVTGNDGTGRGMHDLP